MKDHIAILDFGSQYTHLIARNIRELNVLAKIYPHDASASELENASGIILSGGPQSVYDKNSIKVDQKIFKLGVPLLGLCYGHQLIAHLLGGRVKPGRVREYGRANLFLKGSTPLFKNIRKKTEVWMSHGDSVIKVPKNFIISGSTPNCPVTAMADNINHIYGLQFHPEVDHTREGKKIIENFVINICCAEKNWEIKDLLAHIMEKIKKQVGDKKVFVLVSGGVDSNVSFALLSKALGKERVKGLYIDTGFMRKNESAQIIKSFKKIGFDNLEIVDAGQTFFKNLKQICDPEEKRKIIGQTFLDIKDEVCEKLNLKNWLLGQGTIYPDTIESGGTKNADKIKTHHNRVAAIQKMIDQGLVVEPLVDFYKYEVRQIGRLLKLPKNLIERHPFPGPGLAIRALCFEEKNAKNNIQKTQNKITKFYKNNYTKIFQKLLPIKSVGVQGDNRTYAHPLAVWGENNWEKLDKISVATTNSIHEVNRVVLLLNPDKNNNFVSPSEKLDLSPERINILREIDAIVTKNIIKANLYNDIWQFPVVLIPITDGSGKESIVLRPVNTRDAMTLNFYQMKKSILKKITREILATKKISYIFYDITNKPPGTTEWE
ncbi:MAG: glutamine-hydrolyzing GMP synthase [Patescibacteria group bacterium]|nr:glutamine-hydrolyzing GMP synthase [Patescibacteria group bacterium]MDD4610680.1 glutamine-hydrolyzing GMP synthase [Patescibacteria group bacterium]